jgi:hypothetical protein
VDRGRRRQVVAAPRRLRGAGRYQPRTRRGGRPDRPWHLSAAASRVFRAPPAHLPPQQGNCAGGLCAAVPSTACHRTPRRTLAGLGRARTSGRRARRRSTPRPWHASTSSATPARTCCKTARGGCPHALDLARDGLPQHGRFHVPVRTGGVPVAGPDDRRADGGGVVRPLPHLRPGPRVVRGLASAARHHPSVGGADGDAYGEPGAAGAGGTGWSRTNAATGRKRQSRGCPSSDDGVSNRRWAASSCSSQPGRPDVP